MRVVIRLAPDVYYCRDDVQSTLGWRQLPADQQVKLLQIFDTFSGRADVKALLAAAARLTPEQLSALSIGASRRRMMRAAQQEMRDGW